jgi:uncharacterized protein (TIGR02646 family)
MRSITKIGGGGRQLENSNNTPPTTHSEATSRWQSFGYKKIVTGCLVHEQYRLCAYSEVRPDQLGLGVHIEHVEPKSRNPLRTFDYRNLVLSVLSSDDLHTMNGNDVFGGHAKLSQYDSSLFVSCLEATCPQHFVYLSDGRVEPSNKLDQSSRAKAQYTIDLLNLNCPFLVTQRKNWLDEIDVLIQSHLGDPDSLPYLAGIDLLPWNQKLSQFFTATRQRYGRVAEQLLQEEAPELL